MKRDEAISLIEWFKDNYDADEISIIDLSDIFYKKCEIFLEEQKQ